MAGLDVCGKSHPTGSQSPDRPGSNQSYPSVHRYNIGKVVIVTNLQD